MNGRPQDAKVCRVGCGCAGRGDFSAGTIPCGPGRARRDAGLQGAHDAASRPAPLRRAPSLRTPACVRTPAPMTRPYGTINPATPYGTIKPATPYATVTPYGTVAHAHALGTAAPRLRSPLVRRHHRLHHKGWHFPLTFDGAAGYIGVPYDPAEIIPVYGPPPMVEEIPADAPAAAPMMPPRFSGRATKMPTPAGPSASPCPPRTASARSPWCVARELRLSCRRGAGATHGTRSACAGLHPTARGGCS